MNNHQYIWEVTTQIAKFMGSTWGPPGSCRPRWAPCWPHEPCYQGRTIVRQIIRRFAFCCHKFIYIHIYIYVYIYIWITDASKSRAFRTIFENKLWCLTWHIFYKNGRNLFIMVWMFSNVYEVSKWSRQQLHFWEGPCLKPRVQGNVPIYKVIMPTSLLHL